MKTNCPIGPVTSRLRAIYWRKTLYLQHLPTGRNSPCRQLCTWVSNRDPTLRETIRQGAITATVDAPKFGTIGATRPSGAQTFRCPKGVAIAGSELEFLGDPGRRLRYTRPRAEGNGRRDFEATCRSPLELSLAVARCSGTIMFEMATARIVEREFVSSESLAMAGQIPVACRPSCCCPHACGSG
jgi:hypothetical protein